MNGGWGMCNEIALRWILLDLTDDKSTLVQVMAWCRQATSHYLSQCWPRSLSSYGVNRPQWVLIIIGSGNALVLSSNKPLPEPMLICVTTWCHKVTSSLYAWWFLPHGILLKPGTRTWTASIFIGLHPLRSPKLMYSASYQLISP